MESEKVKAIKTALKFQRDNLVYLKDNVVEYISCKDILTLINELESENDTLHTNLCEWRKENQELKDEKERLLGVIDIANEREYRKKFNDEWRKEYQKELDKQGNGHIAGYPDFDLVYKLYFEQKDRIADLEKENGELNERLTVFNPISAFADNYTKGVKEAEQVVVGALKQFAERLKEHPIMKIYSLHNACERIPKAIDETLKEIL